MTVREQTTDSDVTQAASVAADGRLPYEAPRVISGPVFEKVILTSGCNSTQQFFCPIPCD